MQRGRLERGKEGGGGSGCGAVVNRELTNLGEEEEGEKTANSHCNEEVKL